MWSLVEKQRLIDSMTRRFDIASLYLYQHDDGSIDCVDGRQRIGTIMAFMGENETDQDINFQFQPLNEIYPEDSPLFQSLKGMTFNQITELGEKKGDSTAGEFLDRFLQYPLTVILLSESETSQEFNLQFTRLNLGTIINSGEKLNAMVGDIRDECFGQLGKHSFLEGTNIPTRRYAREQVAAQILAQVLSLEETGEFARTRHFDLQRLFKRYSKFSNEQKALMKRLSKLLDILSEAFEGVSTLRNRAITVSTVLLAWKLELGTEEAASELADFIQEFVHRLNWQIKKVPVVDQEYLYIMEFQRNITQGSAERSSVQKRANMLEEEFKRWHESKELRGDAGWKAQNPGSDPSKASRPWNDTQK